MLYVIYMSCHVHACILYSVIQLQLQLVQFSCMHSVVQLDSELQLCCSLVVSCSVAAHVMANQAWPAAEAGGANRELPHAAAAFARAVNADTCSEAR